MSDSPPSPLPDEIQAYNFFWAVRRLERLLPEGPRVGGCGPAHLERLRFRVSTSLAFPTSDIEAIRMLPPTATRPSRAELTTHFLGLVGSSTPLPLSYAQDVLDLEEEAPQLRDFLDIFHHRLLSLLYRAWLRQRPAHAFQASGRDPMSAVLLELAGVPPEATEEALGINPVRLLRYLGLLVLPSRPTGGLEQLLAEELSVPVYVRPLAARWVELPESQRSRLAKALNRRALGKDLVLGHRIRDVSGVVTLRIGPIPSERRKEFARDGIAIARLVKLARFYLRKAVTLQLELELSASEMPRHRIGGPSRTQIGGASLLGRRIEGTIIQVFHIHSGHG